MPDPLDPSKALPRAGDTGLHCGQCRAKDYRRRTAETKGQRNARAAEMAKVGSPRKRKVFPELSVIIPNIGLPKGVQVTRLPCSPQRLWVGSRLG